MSKSVDKKAATVNPFDSPAVDSQPETSSDELGKISPSARMLWGGLLLGMTIKTIETLPEASLFLDMPPQLIAWCLPQLVMGVIVGLGLALLGDAWWHGKFSALMPGHWCMITYIPMALIGCLIAIYNFVIAVAPGSVSEMLVTYSVVAIEIGLALSGGLVVTFHCAVIKTTREKTTWKAYAYSSMVSWLCLSLSNMARHYGLAEVNELANTVLAMLTGVNYLIATIAFLISVVVDYTRVRPRDIYHWLGLILVFALPMTYCLMFLVHQTYLTQPLVTP